MNSATSGYLTLRHSKDMQIMFGMSVGILWRISLLHVASCGRDKTVWIWDVDNVDFSCNTILQGHSQDVKMVKWSPREDILFSCSYDNSIKIWKYDESQEDWTCTTTLNDHRSTVWCIDISSTGLVFVTCSDDLSIILWGIECRNGHANYNNVSKISVIENAHKRTIFSCSLSFDNSLLITGSSDNSIALWSVSSEQKKIELIQRTENSHDNDVNCVAWNKRYNEVASCGDDMKIKLWKLESI